jgi:hypothetical protein
LRPSIYRTDLDGSIAIIGPERRVTLGAFGWAPPNIISDNSFSISHGTRPVGSACHSKEAVMRRLLLCTVLLLLAASIFSTAEAQTLVASQNKCDYAKQGELQALTDSLFLPIAQEFVNEGKLNFFTSAYHAWGDEWNVVYYYVAESIPAFLEAFEGMVSVMQERHPEFVEFFWDACFEHKDSFYSLGTGTTGPEPPPDR